MLLRSRSAQGTWGGRPGRRISYAVNSFLHDIPQAAERGNPAVVSPGDARAQGLNPGDRVCLEGPGGTTEAALAVSARLPDGSIMLAHGWGRRDPEAVSPGRPEPGANTNALTSDVEIDPYCGMPVFQGHPVRLRKNVG